MRVLHAALMSKPQHGVLQQMRWEAQAAAERSLPWRSQVYGSAEVAEHDSVLVVRAAREPAFDRGGSGPLDVIAWLRWRLDFYRWLHKEAQDVDVVLLRYAPHDPLRPWAIRRTPAPVVSVHHTIEVSELRSAGRQRAASVERLVGRESLRQCAGVAGVTQEILTHQLARAPRHTPGFLYPNGTLNDPEHTLEDRRGDAPTLLFAASEFSPWHGLDLVMHAVLESREEFRLDLVGALSPVDRALPGLNDSRVRVHGVLTGAAFEELKSQAWVGLGSFGMGRSLLTQGSTLKVRDYLRSGLPVYAGHDDVFPDDFEYYRSGPPDLDVIVRQAHKWGLAQREEIIAASWPYIDKAALMSRLHSELLAAFG